MKKSLVDVVFASNKRKETLLLLKDGHQEMESLLKSLETTRSALLPQIRILEEHHLVFHYDDIYELTTIGKLIVDEMNHLIDTFEVLDVDIDYWGTRNIDFIPPNLLKRINKLGKCEIITPNISEIFEVNRSFQDAATRSNSVYIISQVAHPMFPEMFAEMTGNNVEVYDIVSQSLFDSLLANRYTDFKKIIENKLVHIYVYPRKMDFLYIGFSNYKLMLSLLTKDEDFDNKYLLCQNPSALQWGKEIFEYYLKDSKPLTDI